jgi:chromosome segregation ATPase
VHETIKELRERVFRLEEEKAALDRDVRVTKESELRRLRLDKQHLEDRLREPDGTGVRCAPPASCYGGVLTAGCSGSVAEPSALQAEATALRGRVSTLEDQLLDRENAVAELRFDVEMAVLQRARLERRATDLEAYIAAVATGRPLPAAAAAAAAPTVGM